MTDEVAALVLRDNVLQIRRSASPSPSAAELLDAEIGLMRKLERQGRLNRAIEMLPGDETWPPPPGGAGALPARGRRAPRLRQDDDLRRACSDRTCRTGPTSGRPGQVFPAPAAQAFRATRSPTHRLRREIIATWLANSIVNRGLQVIASELEDEAGATLAEIALGYVAARDAYQILPAWGQVEALPAAVPVELQLELLRELRRVLVRGTRWFLANGGKSLTLREVVGRFGPGIARIVAELETVLGAEAAATLSETAASYVAQGVEGTLARSLAASPYLLPSGDVVLVARNVAGDPDPQADSDLTTARVYFALERALGIGWLRERLALVAPSSSWDRLALAGLEDELSAVLRRLTLAALDAGVPGGSVEAAEKGVEGYLASGVHGFDRYKRLKEELATVERLDLAALSVAARALGGLVPGG